ncbi:hypothetical protein GVN24_34215 [Rhizobium sp. CRIBSB]|nr:hypothetical protein [Rhizobium sp. CRIBSB]
MQRFVTTALAAAALLVLTGGWSGQEQRPAGATDAEVAAVQSLLTERNGTVSTLWRVERERFVADLSGNDSLIPANARNAFGRAYLRTTLAPSALAELERSFNRVFASAMTEQERLNPSSLSAERQSELTLLAEGAIGELLSNIHTAGLADACEESRARAYLCVAASIMTGTSNPWRRLGRR